jgi:hypothetical protein
MYIVTFQDGAFNEICECENMEQAMWVAEERIKESKNVGRLIIAKAVKVWDNGIEEDV